jgi:glycyl-tRNA synthetase
MAPVKVGVFPLMPKDGLDKKAKEIFEKIKKERLIATYDESGSIGRRYARVDEVGVPYCITVDYQSLEDDSVTLRDRDSTKQIRVSISDITTILKVLINEEKGFEDIWMK